MMSLRQLVVGCVLALGATGVVAIGWLFFGDAIQERWRRRPFDLVAWQADAHRSTDPVRIRMVDDLLRRYQFVGMTRQEVTAVIGEPDRTDYFREWDMVYWLGPERSPFGIDSEWLVFRLGREKEVVEYRIVTD